MGLHSIMLSYKASVKSVTMNSHFGARKVRTPRLRGMIPQQQSTASKAHHHVRAQAWRMLSTFVPRLATTAANSSACRGLMRPFQASLMTCIIPAPPGQSEVFESHTCLQFCCEEALIVRPTACKSLDISLCNLKVLLVLRQTRDLAANTSSRQLHA